MRNFKQTKPTVFSLTAEQQVNVLHYFWVMFMKQEHNWSKPLAEYEHFGIVPDRNGNPTILLSVNEISFMNKEVILDPGAINERILIETEKIESNGGYFVAIQFITETEAAIRRNERKKQGWSEQHKKAS